MKRRILGLSIYASAVENLQAQAPLQITAAKKDVTAYIGIKGFIYKWNQASSMDVEKVVKDFVKDGAIKAEIYINSGGGDCFEANEIENIIAENFKPENVIVRVGAVAASAATIFIAKYKTTAKKNSQIMIHKPMGNPSGNEDDIEASLQLIKNLTNQYRSDYATKMGISEDDVEKKWKKDYWLTASKAKDEKLIDAIENEAVKIDASARMQLVACGAPNIPKIENNQNQNKHMELSVLAVQLGLPSTATQAEVDAKLKAIQLQAAKADGLVQAAADQLVASKKAEKKVLLDAAEKDKKITAEQRPHLETMEVDALTAVLGAMKSIQAISDNLTPGDGGKTGNEKWTYADYQEKDPKAFEQLDEKVQASLIEAHYKE